MGFDRKFEPIKREILRVDPLPTAEAAYAMVRKEAAHQIILGVTNETHGIATGLIAGETYGMGFNPDWWTDGHKTASNKGAKKDKPSTSPTANTRNSTKNSNDRRSEGGFRGVTTAIREEGEESFLVKGKGERGLNSKSPISFHLYTFKNRDSPFMSKTGHQQQYLNGSAYMAQTHFKNPNGPWIFDCGATDTMSYELSDFTDISKPIKTHIQVANRERMNLKTEDMRTGRIIGRGTERDGLYYVDEVVQSGTVMLAHGTTEKEAWLWHRRLGHPSVSYLHTLFPDLFPLNKPSTCETCILAKSHRQHFKPKNTRVKAPFSLVHYDVWGPAPVIGGQNF
nr:putative ribonuclease H-like domain-containing protein [Tanacetum cinerariifolium]